MQKYRLPTFFVFLIACNTAWPAWPQQRCSAVQARQEFLENNPEAAQQKTGREQLLTDWINARETGANMRAVVTIPVVVHVIYNSSLENISDDQIISQINILNEDFRALNVEAPNVPTVFKPLVADVELEFCLANVDPNGHPTNGITRRFTTNAIGIAATPSIHYTALGGQDAWDTQRYLNIWVAKFAGNIGGIASFPGIGLPAEDGVEINFLQFGNLNTNPPYHLGRTLTHEIGHYLNLEHPWGPQPSDCCADDFVADTPKACETYIGECPAHPVVSCDMPDMFMNFMFYTDDACMAMFTPGQKMRMLATLNTLRSGLLSSQACMPLATAHQNRKSLVRVLGNPVSQKILLEIGLPVHSGLCNVQLMDVAGRVWHRETLQGNGLHNLHLEAIPSGIYLLVVEIGGEIFAERVVLRAKIGR